MRAQLPSTLAGGWGGGGALSCLVRQGTSYESFNWNPIHFFVHTCAGTANNSLTGFNHRVIMYIQNTHTAVT